MNIVDIRRYEMLVRVEEFGVVHAAAFPAASLGGQTFAVVTTAVGALRAQLTAQATGEKRNAMTSKSAARQALRDALEAISRTARAIGSDTPGVREKFRLPRRHGDQQLIAAARAFAQNAAAVMDHFITHNMPPTFVADLNNGIAAFEQAILASAVIQENRAAAKQAIRTAMEAGDAAVRRLDAIVENKLRADQEALAIWAQARRISHVVGRHHATPAIGAQPVTPPVTPPVTKSAA